MNYQLGIMVIFGSLVSSNGQKYLIIWFLFIGLSGFGLMTLLFCFCHFLEPQKFEKRNGRMRDWLFLGLNPGPYGTL